MQQLILTPCAFPLALCTLLLLALDSAFGNPHSAIEWANFFMDATGFY
jgi:hypothetical protein